MKAGHYKAIVPDTSPEVLSWRLATGRDFRDEVWEGVYHVVEDKSRIQLDLENELESWLITHWGCLTGGRVFRETRLSTPDHWDLDLDQIDYRVPSLCLYTRPSSTAYVDQVLVEPPDVVIEVLGVEANGTQKADFYRALGVREVWVFDSRNGLCELIRCEDRRWLGTSSNETEAVHSEVTGISIGAMTENPLALELFLSEDCECPKEEPAIERPLRKAK